MTGVIGGDIEAAVTVTIADFETDALESSVHANVYVLVDVGVTTRAPDAGCGPLHAPEAVHETAPDDDHVKVAL